MSKWYTITPITSSYNSKEVRLTKPLDLGNNVHFTIVPTWLDKVKGREHLSFYQRQVIDDTQYILVSEYEASALGDIDLDWKGENRRAKQETALEKIQIANLALWLNKPSWIGFGLVLHIEDRDGDKVLRQSFSTQPLTPHNKDKDSYLKILDFEQICELNLALYHLDRTKALWITIKTLWTALITLPWEVRFLFLWIALESIFGTNAEITYRISHRIAFFLSSKREEALKLYKEAKTAYIWRSKVVHGMKLSSNKKTESAEILYNSENFVRKALIKILNEEELFKIFNNDERREEYLDNLIFKI